MLGAFEAACHYTTNYFPRVWLSNLAVYLQPSPEYLLLITFKNKARSGNAASAMAGCGGPVCVVPAPTALQDEGGPEAAALGDDGRCSMFSVSVRCGPVRCGAYFMTCAVSSSASW